MEIKKILNEDFEYENDSWDDGEVEQGKSFFEDGYDWKWIRRVGDVQHLDFDNWAVWMAFRPEDENNPQGRNVIGFFLVDEDTGFIDWGPCDTYEEAKEFLDSKVQDWEMDESLNEDFDDDLADITALADDCGENTFKVSSRDVRFTFTDDAAASKFMDELRDAKIVFNELPTGVISVNKTGILNEDLSYYQDRVKKLLASDLVDTVEEAEINGNESFKVKANNGKVIYLVPSTLSQVDVYDENGKQLDRLAFWYEIVDEYLNDGEIGFIYELVGGECDGTYTKEEVESLPCFSGEYTADQSDIRSKGGFTSRPELDNQPKLNGYLGPMHDGYTDDHRMVLRYETQEVYDRLSESSKEESLVKNPDKEGPYSKKQIEQDLYWLTDKFTRDDTLKCGYKEEAEYSEEILSQHYASVEIDKVGSWFQVTFKDPFKKKDENVNESTNPADLTDCPECGDVSFDTRKGRCIKCSYRESLKKPLSESTFRGVPNTTIISHGGWGDPEIATEYEGKTYVANYWEIEDAAYQFYKDDEKYMNSIDDNEADRLRATYKFDDSEEDFNKWCREHSDYIIYDIIELGRVEDDLDESKSNVSALHERGLTRAERHNRNMEKTFAHKKQIDHKMMQFLRDNSDMSEEDIQKAYDDDKLGLVIKNLGLQDAFWDKKNESKCIKEASDTFITPEGKELKSSFYVSKFKDAIKTAKWHKKYGQYGEVTNISIDNANKSADRLRMQLNQLFGFTDDEINQFEEEALSEPLSKNYLEESKSIKEDLNDPDEILTFKRDINLANNEDEIQLLIYELSDGVAEDNAQQAYDENESNDLETLKSAVITAIDVYLEDDEWLGESKSTCENWEDIDNWDDTDDYDFESEYKNALEEVAEQLDNYGEEEAAEYLYMNNHIYHEYKDKIAKELDIESEYRRWTNESKSINEGVISDNEEIQKLWDDFFNKYDKVIWKLNEIDDAKSKQIAQDIRNKYKELEKAGNSNNLEQFKELISEANYLIEIALMKLKSVNESKSTNEDFNKYRDEEGHLLADKWYASVYPDDEIGIEQLNGLTMDDILKNRNLVDHCDTQVRERVYKQLDKYSPIIRESYRQETPNNIYKVGDRVAQRWADEFNVGTIVDTKEEDGIQYKVEWDYSEGPDVEWLYGTDISLWIDEDEPIEERYEPEREERLSNSKIIRALKNHSIDYKEEDGKIIGIAAYTKGGKTFEDEVDLTNCTYQDLRNFLGYDDVTESLNESFNDYIYLFPELTDDDIKMMAGYNIKYLGMNHGPDGSENNWVVYGAKEDIEKYAEKYLDYELHPDYLYEYDDFAGEIVN